MSPINVENQVYVYADHGNRSVYPDKKLLVRSVFNDNEKVLLVYGDTEIAVVANDLMAAISNATNTGKGTI